IAGEGVTIALREVRVGVAQIEREDLVGKTDADIPGVVAGLGNAVGEGSTKGRSNGGAVERVGCSEPLPAELAGDIHADGAAAENCAVTLERGALRTEPLPTRIDVTPNAEVEGEHADGRADTTVDIDFSRRAVREGDALTGSADVELHVLVDVVARLEVGG